MDKRDMGFLALIVLVLGIVVSLSGREKTKPVPLDANHRTVYEVAYGKAPGPDASLFRRLFFKPDKKRAEANCQPCHKARGVRFPPDHPPKNRCLFCHKLQNPRQ
jgi:hypothetical protein